MCKSTLIVLATKLMAMFNDGMAILYGKVILAKFYGEFDGKVIWQS